jgi:putative ABC transport system permease protein
MIRNYLLLALRHSLRQKWYTLVNLISLSLAIVSVFFIAQYIVYETGFDEFHEDADSIYRVVWQGESPQTRVPHPMAQAMKNEFPEVASAVSLTPLWGAGLTRQTFSFRNEEADIQFDETSILAVDSTFFEVFSFKMIHGNGLELLRKPNCILISESAGKRYFGSANPVGRTLSINDARNTVEVLGVFEDVPEQSHFHFDFLVSYVGQKQREDAQSEYHTWKDFGHYNYVRLNPGADAKALESKLLSWVAPEIGLSPEDLKHLQENGHGFALQKITDIHLNSHLRWELEPTGNIQYVYILAAAALLILVVAAFNYMNLSTALATNRRREIGVRKTMGAIRAQLMAQFTSEAIVAGSCSAALSLVLIELLAPVVEPYMGGAQFETPVIAAVVLLIGVGVGVMSGIYPALILSSPNPVQSLKTKAGNGGGRGFRNGFMVFQFACSFVLISVSYFIYQQLDLIQNRSLGFEKDAVVVVPLKNQAVIGKNWEAFKAELLKVGGVGDVSATSNIPGKSFNQQEIFDPKNPQHAIDASEMVVEKDFLSTLSIPLVEGRQFSSANGADSGNSFLINAAAKKRLYSGNALGQELVIDRDGTQIRGTIIGIVDDFHYQSLHTAVQPLVIQLGESNLNFICIRLSSSDYRAVIEQVEAVYRRFDERFEFQFSFLSEDLNRQYAEEQKMEFVLVAFAGISVIIASLGLIAIAALNFQLRTKEISVRKVLGASMPSIIRLLLKEFVLTVSVGVLVGVPLSWYVVSQWIQNFTLRIDLNPTVYVVVGLGLLIIAILSVLLLTIRAARTNVATTLKQEN